MNFILLSSTFFTIIKMNHPMFFLVALIFLSLSYCMFLLMSSLSYWLVILVFLTYVGGLMVVFLYLVSLTPNEEEFKLKFFTYLLVMGVLLMYQNVMGFFTKSFLESYNSNFLMIFVLFLIMALMALLSTKMIISPFKALKSSS